MREAERGAFVKVLLAVVDVEAQGTDVWHYVGKAGTPVMVDSLGQYILATSIHNDHTAPEVTMDFNPQSRILNIALSDNIGVRVGTLQVMINNELRKKRCL